MKIQFFSVLSHRFYEKITFFNISVTIGRKTYRIIEFPEQIAIPSYSYMDTKSGEVVSLRSRNGKAREISDVFISKPINLALTFLLDSSISSRSFLEYIQYIQIRRTDNTMTAI